MTLWAPRLTPSDAPIYQRIADQLERDVAEGLLVAGSRLPTHRELARRLGVTVVTITRAYAEAAERGLVETTVGRGSFVRAPRRESVAGNGGREIDLSMNAIEAPPPPFSKELAQRLAATLMTPYGGPAGTERHRAAGAVWMGRQRPDAVPERVFVTSGAQHAMHAALAALTKPGDTVLTEAVTYFGIKAVAGLLRLELEPVAVDRHGLQPGALEQAARRSGARVLYITPTLHNPTGSVMPDRRRRDVATLAERLGITIVEDDVHGFLAPDAPPPITSHVEGVFLTGVGKSLAPALRVGWLLAPEGLAARIQSAMFATSLFPSPLGAEIAASWIEDGTAERIVAHRRATIATRQRMARRILGSAAGHADERSPHLWIELPRRWTPEAFAEDLRTRGVRVAPAGMFATGTEVPRAIRICLGAASAAEAETAINVIATAMVGEERLAASVI